MECVILLVGMCNGHQLCFLCSESVLSGKSFLCSSMIPLPLNMNKSSINAMIKTVVVQYLHHFSSVSPDNYIRERKDGNLYVQVCVRVGMCVHVCVWAWVWACVEYLNVGVAAIGAIVTFA